jgi:signal peptidase I
MTTMLGLAVAVFLVLRGFVHPWYVVLSQGWVEMEDGE